MTKVSIIMPVYNSEATVGKSIESVLEQTYKNIELIIINDGSNDNTEQIIMKYANSDSRIQYIFQENEGVSSARNAGIIIATGDYIAFIDADDYYSKNMIEILISQALKLNADIVSCSFERIFNDIRFSQKTYLDAGFYDKNELETVVYPEIIMGNSLIYKIPLTIVTKIFRKSIIDKYNLQFNIELSYGEDLLFCREFFLHADSFYYLPNEFLYKYVNTTSSATNSFINDSESTLSESLNSQKYLVSKFIKYKLNDQIKYHHVKIAMSRVINIIRYMSGTKEEIKDQIKLIVNNNQINNSIKEVSTNSFSVLRKIIYILIKDKKINNIYFLNRLYNNNIIRFFISLK